MEGLTPGTARQTCKKSGRLALRFWGTEYAHLCPRVMNIHFSITCAVFRVKGCTPLNAVPILSCVKAYSKNCHFRVFIMIKIGQTHIFLKDYVHIHQIGSHFAGGYQLDFSPTRQETRPSFCKLLALGSPRLLQKKQNKKLPNLSVLNKNTFFTEICWERHQISTSTTKNKQAKAIFQFFY